MQLDLVTLWVDLLEGMPEWVRCEGRDSGGRITCYTTLQLFDIHKHTHTHTNTHTHTHTRACVFGVPG